MLQARSSGLNRKPTGSDMPTASTGRRGRPRGSGLDDRAKLAAISQLIEQDPSLRPTTAIKRLGISDPSTIRRLRDKLRMKRAIAVSPPSSVVSAKSKGRAHAMVSPALESSSDTTRNGNGVEADAATSVSEWVSKRSEIPGVASVGVTGAAPAAEFMAHCMTFGVQAWLSAAEAQRQVMFDMVRLPHVKAAMTAQVAMLSFVRTCCSSNGDASF